AKSKMRGLLEGEIRLTLDIIFGLVVGEIVIRLGVAEFLLKKFSRLKIPPVSALAVALSAGSSKTGAAVIAAALEKKQISERAAVWSVLMLPFPSYLRRWPGTFALAVGMAGRAGAFFAVSLLFRSAARFLWACFIVKGEKETSSTDLINKINKTSQTKLFGKLLKTLPYAWVFFAVSYSLVPMMDKFFESNMKFFSFLPLAGWTVAAGSIAHVSSALALAGGAMAAGELNTAQATFALILGSGLGTATRILRQNAGYYFGLFPPGTAKKMLVMNFATIMPLILLNLIFAGLALLF
ncbi:MAG: hypothetical protein IJU31_03000, partial [Synergistaceae bacterium]|nr:hypothetical protein [Synergistaceae bacterium]